MYSMSNLVLALIIGGGIGGVAGWYLALNARGDNKRKVIMDLENQLDQAKQDRADYEAEVSEHFSQTADLLHKLISLCRRSAVCEKCSDTSAS